LNYYQHHIGDYRRDTGHLSLLEHGIYRQLLDTYYLTEQPIPEETELVFRRLSAKTDEEKKAVEMILSEFFYKENGWHHKRCDVEILTYLEKAETARTNGKLGGRPRKTQPVISGNPEQTNEKANQEPITINHKPNITTLSGKPDGAGKKQSFREPAIRIIDFLNAKTGKAFRHAPANIDFIAARLREGATEQDCKSVIARKTRDWLNTDQAKYLRPETLFNATKFNSYVGELVAPQSNPWDGAK